MFHLKLIDEPHAYCDGCVDEKTAGEKMYMVNIADCNCRHECQGYFCENALGEGMRELEDWCVTAI